MARHRATKKVGTPLPPDAPRLVRSLTLLVDLKSDMSASCLVGVLNLATRRPTFVRIDLNGWYGAPEDAALDALLLAVQRCMNDAELRALIR